jgi:DnaJ-class molecular chaperone
MRAKRRSSSTLRWGIPVFQPCADCRDSGRQGQYSCQPCKESGLLEEDPSIRIDIPPGVPDGAIFFVPLRGLGIQNLSLRVPLRIVADH